MRVLATDLARNGQWTEAKSFAEALLLRDPGDVFAVSLLAQSSFQLGDMDTAYQAAVSIYRSDAPASDRYQAARLAALASANRDRFTLGEIWLRRALTVAPSVEDAAQTRTDAAGLRRVNPWSTSVSLSFAPSNNVNGGATEAEILVDGQPLIDPFFGLAAGVLTENRAVSGWAYVIEPSVSYRLPTHSEAVRTTVQLRGYYRGVLLSEESRDFLDRAVPIGSRPIGASYYSTGLIEASLAHDRVVAQGVLSLQLASGRTWARTDPNYDFLRFTARKTEKISSRDLLFFSATTERRYDTESDGVDSDRLILSAEWQHQLGNRDILGFGLSSTKIDSARPTVRSLGWGVNASYQLAQPVGPASIKAGLSVGQLEYPDFGIGFSAIPREDMTIRGSLVLSFEELSYAGFVPMLTATGERRISNINMYENDSLGIEFSLRSAF